jgi:ubiquinone/menaquinone biosynthesis C-methylase UbiE
VAEKHPPPEVLAYYAAFDEAARLDVDYFPLERARTQEIVLRFLPPPPAVVLDVGGGAGAYAFWLAERGYAVHLVDPVPGHLEQARSRMAAGTAPLASVTQGDARSLEFAEASADAVLMLGPLYHLPMRYDRLAALREAGRVLRPGGLLFAAGISRFASLLDGLRTGKVLDDSGFASIVERDLQEGRHVNETGDLRYFTTAYFHRPEELQHEVEETGFASTAVYAVEGPGFMLPSFAARFMDARQRDVLLGFLRRVERDPALVAVSPHLLAVARRP